jgi:hypothetical protein
MGHWEGGWGLGRGRFVVLVLLAFRYKRPHLNYLNTTTGSLFKIKFYVLPFGQRFKFYTSKLAGVEEIVFSVLSLYKPKSTICA